MKKMELNQLNLLGGICIVLAVIFALNFIDGFLGLTGNVISDKANASFGSFFGIFFFLIGLSIFVCERVVTKESDLQKIVSTSELPPVKQERDYGPIPQESETSQWVILYHAAPRGKFRFRPDEPLSKKNVNSSGFYMSTDSVAATEELGSVDPSDVEIHKIKIARSVYMELGLEEMSSHMNSQTEYGAELTTKRLARDNLYLFNDLFKKGYIKLGRGR